MLKLLHESFYIEYMESYLTIQLINENIRNAVISYAMTMQSEEVKLTNGFLKFIMMYEGCHIHVYKT